LGSAVLAGPRGGIVKFLKIRLIMDDSNSPLGKTFKENFVSNPLYEMRQNYVQSSPFAMQENRCGEFDSVPSYVEYYSINSLVRDLEKSINDNNYYFNAKDYTSSLPRPKVERAGETFNDGTDKRAEKRKQLDQAKNYSYTDKDGIRTRAEIDACLLNPRICNLDPKVSFRINVDPEVGFLSFDLSTMELLMFEVRINYANTKKFRHDNLSTSRENDYTLSHKYVAIIIKTRDVYAFEDIINRISGKNTIRATIKARFDEMYNSSHSAFELNWFYSYAPYYVIDDIEKHLLWADLKTLLNLDANGWLSCVKDSSNAMLNIVKSFCSTKDGVRDLYEKFNSEDENPHICYKIYEHMSGSSNFHGEDVPNKTIFTGLMIGLSELNASRILNISKNTEPHVRNKTHINFRFSKIINLDAIKTKQYLVDSNIASKDTKYGYFNLTQLEKYTQPGPPPTNKMVSSDVGQTEFLHPLDLVMIDEQKENGARLVKAYPAIYVKNLAHINEWNDVMQAIRIAVDILLVIVPFGVYLKLIKSISTFLYAVSIVDAIVAGIDLMVIGIKPILEGSELGSEFIKHWETFYTYAGVTTGVLTLPAAVAALGKLMLSGGKMLWKIANTVRYIDEIEEIVLKALYYSIKRSPNFPRSVLGQFQFIIGTAIQAIFGKASINILKLQEQGVIVVGFRRMIDGKAVDLYYLIYRDVIIAEGRTGAEIEKAIAPYFGKNDQVLVEVLEQTTRKVNIDELIPFLDNIREFSKVVDLEEFGITALFRGTTRDSKGRLYIGNTNSQKFGFSTSTDPLRAIVFAIEGATHYNKKGVLQIFLTRNLRGITLRQPNRRVHFELEVILNARAEELQELVAFEIPVEKVIDLANEFFNLEPTLSTRINMNSDESRYLMQDLLPKISPNKAYEFYLKLLNL
jgi:hypothetical protein